MTTRPLTREHEDPRGLDVCNHIQGDQDAPARKKYEMLLWNPFYTSMFPRRVARAREPTRLTTLHPLENNTIHIRYM